MFAGINHTGGLEDAKVLRDIALRGADRLDNILHHQLARGEQAQYLDAQRVRHGLHRNSGLLDLLGFADE